MYTHLKIGITYTLKYTVHTHRPKLKQLYLKNSFQGLNNCHMGENLNVIVVLF